MILRLAGPEPAARRWIEAFRAGWCSTEVLVLLAATDTAAVPGISAAGATPASRRLTAAADAELLHLGPAAERPHALPPLPAGVSPALISHVVLREIGVAPLLIDLGCPCSPAVPHLRPFAAQGPAACLSSGRALEPEQVERLLALGRVWGRRVGPRPLLIAECVPGGTSTALAVLEGLGIAAAGLVSGSLRLPAHALKARLVTEGLRRAGLGSVAGNGPAGHGPAGGGSDPRRVLAAVGDPMQALAAGLLLGWLERPDPLPPVLLAGGSQMAAVLALALALAPSLERRRLAAAAAVGTTAWVAREAGSDLAALLVRIGTRWGVEPLAFAADLRFHGCTAPQLRDYERGYVKEGVGAGGLALLWALSGREDECLARLCDEACAVLVGAPAL